MACAARASRDCRHGPERTGEFLAAVIGGVWDEVCVSCVWDANVSCVWDVYASCVRDMGVSRVKRELYVCIVDVSRVLGVPYLCSV